VSVKRTAQIVGKPAVASAINPIKQRWRNDSFHRRVKINTARSTSRLHHDVYRAVWLCQVPMGVKLCLESSTFEVCFMALDKDPMHATMLNSFAQDVLNSLQNRKWCYCTPTWNFSSIWRLLLFRSAVFLLFHIN